MKNLKRLINTITKNNKNKTNMGIDLRRVEEYSASERKYEIECIDITHCYTQYIIMYSDHYSL